jgi:sugar O-acyltransferase (sialic acid O-acetyltransferase NeuD family)
MAEALLVIGAGGFGREAIDVAEAMNAVAPEPVWDVLGVADDGPSETNLVRLKARGVPYVGDLSHAPDGAALVIGIGSPRLRRIVADRLGGFRYATLVHPTAVIGSEVVIGEGTVVCALVSLGTNVRLGQHVHLNPQAVIGHDTHVDDFASVNPNATVSGDCHVGSAVLVGAASVILQGLRVGSDATVGAAACVISDVESRRTVKGVPAR